MKKLLLASIGIMLSAWLGTQMSSVVLAAEENATLLEKLFKDAGIEKVYKNDAKELEKLSADSDLAFNNLYLFMYQNISEGPQEAAIDVVKKRTKYTESELKSIVLEGDTSPIIDRRTRKYIETRTEAEIDAIKSSEDEFIDSFIADGDFSPGTEEFIRDYYDTNKRTNYEELGAEKTEALTQEEILDEFAYVNDQYRTELEFQRENRKTVYQALSSEIFMNNDLTDSANVDLMYDLDLINYILFGEYLTLPNREGDAEVELSSLSDSYEVELAAEDDPVDDTESFSPYACFEDAALAEAIAAFEELAVLETTDTTETSSGTSGGRSIPSFGSESESSSDGGDTDTDTSTSSEETVSEEDVPNLDDLADLIDTLSKTKGDWTRQLPCGDVFCITLEIISATGDSDKLDQNYEESDNCVACHVAYIKERIEETTSKSLVPSKVSTNYFEDATCKEAGKGVDLDFNVNAIKKPIVLDPGDDTDDVANKSVSEFKEKMWSLGLLTLPDMELTPIGVTTVDEACKALINLIEVSEIQVDIERPLSDCENISSLFEEDRTAAIEEFFYNNESQENEALYEQVAAELFSMGIYFKSFNEGLEDTYLTDDNPLSSLLSKEYCK